MRPVRAQHPMPRLHPRCSEHIFVMGRNWPMKIIRWCRFPPIGEPSDETLEPCPQVMHCPGDPAHAAGQ